MKKYEMEKILKKARNKTRKQDACVLALEEISELITELTLLSNNEGSHKHTSEEISDVLISIDLICGVYHISNKDINKFKKSHAESFKIYSKSHSIDFNIHSAISELSLLQKTICKMARGRSVKGKLVDAIASTELSLEYLQNSKIVRKKEVDNWKMRKIKRMKSRLDKNGLM